MIKKRNASKLALHAETVRQLDNKQLRAVVGGDHRATTTTMSKYTDNSCSSQTFEYTCCGPWSEACTESALC